jgi:flagellar hook-associated protein 1 FlgK
MGQGGVSALLDISGRALSVQSQALRVIGNNVANVNTPGYARRRVEIVETKAIGLAPNAFGSGSEIEKVSRIIDVFLNREELGQIQDRAREGIAKELLERAEQIFSLGNTSGQVGTEMTAFFAALQDLAISPADIGLRAALIDRGNALATAVRRSYDTLADLQREADDRLRLQVDDINRIAGQIASLNAEISANDSVNQENLTLRDQRDNLLRELSERITTRQIESNDGSVMVTLENGFALVIGNNSRDLIYTPAPSFNTTGQTALDGGKLGYIVYDFDSSATSSHVDLSPILAGGGGEVAGLLSVRGLPTAAGNEAFDAAGDLIDLGSRVEALARDLLTRFNQVYLGPVDETPGGVYNPSSGDLAGATPPVFGLFTFAGAVDAVADGLPQQSDLTTIGLNNYASLLEFGVSDPSEIAASVDLDPAPGALSFAPGDASNIQALLDARGQAVNFGNYLVGTFSSTTTIEELYQSTVTFAGSMAKRTQDAFSNAEARETQVKELIASTQGVSLDEEFANLINYQRSFQASARMVRTADDLLSEILNLFS